MEAAGAPCGGVGGPAAAAATPSAEELRQALAKTVAEAFQSLHRAQDIIERELPGALASALAPRGDAPRLGPPRGAPAAPPADDRPAACRPPPPTDAAPPWAPEPAGAAAGEGAPPRGPTARGAGPLPACSAEVPGSVIGEAPEAALAAGAFWALRCTAEGGGDGGAHVDRGGAVEELRAPDAAGEGKTPECLAMSIVSPRTSHATVRPQFLRGGSVCSSLRRSSPRMSSLRGTVPATRIDQQDLIKHIDSLDSSSGVVSRWAHMVRSLQEITTSALSQLHSTWTDTRTFGILVCATKATDSAADLYITHCHSSSKIPALSETQQTRSDWLVRLCHALRYIIGIVFHPFTKTRIAWDFMGMALCFHDVMMFPAEVFELPDNYMTFRKYYEFFACLFWSTDIPINFSTGYISMEGLLEMRKHRVVRHYGRTWAVPDMVITCIDWVGLFANVNNSGVLRFGKAASRTMRSLRLLRLPRLSKSLSVASGANNSEAVTTLAGVAKLLVLLILVTHYVACTWHWLADSAGEEFNWHDRFLLAGSSQPYEYLTSMHWAITQFTPASMEVVPVNAKERLFTCVVIVVAMVFFSSFVSSITHAMTNLRMIHSRKLEQEMFMAKYFSEFRISRELASRCRHFVKQHQKMASKRLRGSDIPWSKSLPRFIIEDLRCEALVPFLRAHPFFDFYAVVCPVGMRQLCCLATEEVSMLPQEQMFWGGQPVNRMLFVRVGSVFYKDDHTDIETLQVKVGEWACEETLWSKVSLLSRPLTASTLGCELITILPSEFQMLTRIHPPALRFCVSYASVFIKSFNCASKDPNYRNLLFNDFQETSNMVMEACTGLDDHLSNKQGTRYQVSQSKKNLLRVGRSRRGSRES